MKKPKKAETITDVFDEVSGILRKTRRGKHYEGDCEYPESGRILSCEFCGRDCKGRYCCQSCRDADVADDLGDEKIRMREKRGRLP